MGKTTTAQFFRRLGVSVFDADRCVHELYQGPVAEIISKSFPGAVRDGVVDRKALGALVLNDPKSMSHLEAIIHPMVKSKRIEFLRRMQTRGERLIVLDIPLLFEGGGLEEVDAILVVTAHKDEQRRRVLARPDMNQAKFSAIIEKQLPDNEKKMRAHFIVQTNKSLLSTERQIKRLISAICYF
jgi:dephospho-CoA kinase